MDVTELMILLIPVLALVVFAAFVSWRFHENRKCIENWARENGYTLLEAEDSYDGYPTHWCPRTGAAYRITVTDACGETRRGWFYCGYPFAESCGKIEVVWSEDSSRQPSISRLQPAG